MSQYFVTRSVCTSWASYMISRQQRLSSVIAPILLQFCLWYGIFQNFQQFNFAVCRSIWDASSPQLLNGFGWNVVEGRRSVPDSLPSGEPKMYCEEHIVSGLLWPACLMLLAQEAARRSRTSSSDRQTDKAWWCISLFTINGIKSCTKDWQLPSGTQLFNVWIYCAVVIK